MEKKNLNYYLESILVWEILRLIFIFLILIYIFLKIIRIINKLNII